MSSTCRAPQELTMVHRNYSAPGNQTASCNSRVEVGSSEPPGAPASRSGLSETAISLPLTDLQEVYWSGRAPNAVLGNVACQVYQEHDTLDLDTQRLEQALNVLIERHDSLRTEFADEGQVVRKQVTPFQIVVEDLSALSTAQQLSRLEQKRRVLANRMLPHDQAPLIDCQATRLDARRMRIHWNFDQLVLDHWSLPTLSDELQSLYRDPSALLPEPISGVEEWFEAQRQRVNTLAYEHARRYWWQRLSELPPCPRLPTGRNLCEIKRPVFSRRLATIAASRRTALERRAQSMGVSVTVLLLAAFAEVVRGWSLRRPFTLGVTLPDRTGALANGRQRIGNFGSLELLEISDCADSFVQRVARVDAQLAQDLEHQQVSAVSLLRELEDSPWERAAALTPVAFTSTLDEIPESKDPFSWLGRERYGISQTPQVSLHHLVRASTDGIALIWDYVEEAYPVGVIDKMFVAYLSLIEQLIKSPDGCAVRH